MGPLTLAIACRTPKPWYRPGSASRSSSASCSPVDAPLGTAARPSAPSSRTISTSTVGFPRESRISRAETSSISDMAGRWYRTFRSPTGGSAVGLPGRRFRELPEGAHPVEPELAVELLGPIGAVRDQEHEVRGVARRGDRGREERARDAAVPVRLQRVDALDLGDAVAEVDHPGGDPGALGGVVEHELAMPEAFERPVGFGGELARRRGADRALDPQEVAVPPIGEPVVVQHRAEAPRLDPAAGRVLDPVPERSDPFEIIRHGWCSTGHRQRASRNSARSSSSGAVSTSTPRSAASTTNRSYRAAKPAIVRRSADSGSTPSFRATATVANKTSPTSPSAPSVDVACSSSSNSSRSAPIAPETLRHSNPHPAARRWTLAARPRAGRDAGIPSSTPLRPPSSS